MRNQYEIKLYGTKTKEILRMKLIVGLGNPGKKYEGTRHNIGFIVLDEWAYQHRESFNKTGFKGEYFETFVNGEKIIFLKPTTFMNNSGEAVRAVADYYSIPVEDILVVYDDLDMDPGRIRLRQKGSAGGHNGVKSLIAHLGTDKIRRIKLGIGHPGKSGTVVHHVLSKFPKEDHTQMLAATRSAVEAIDYWLAGHTFEETMTNFNH